MNRRSRGGYLPHNSAGVGRSVSSIADVLPGRSVAVSGRCLSIGARRFGLTLPDDVAVALEVHVARLVQDATAAAGGHSGES